MCQSSAGEGDTASLQTAPSASTISNEDEYQMASEELAALAEASSSAYVQVGLAAAQVCFFCSRGSAVKAFCISRLYSAAP